VKRLRFLPQAEAELLHEIEYYSKAREGAGIRFQAAVEYSLDRALRHPMSGAPCHQGTRSLLVKGFPFSIVYRPSDGGLLVVAIAAHRRQPGYWLSRLRAG
jgi:plasmid stabilization system protein ParE